MLALGRDVITQNITTLGPVDVLKLQREMQKGIPQPTEAIASK